MVEGPDARKPEVFSGRGDFRELIQGDAMVSVWQRDVNVR